MQLQRVVGGHSGRLVRCMSTASSEYAGSKNYVPGKQGYAPGFPPPKSWAAEPRAKPIPKKAKDIPPPSPKQTEVPQQPIAATDARRMYNQKMRAVRYGYFRENLEQREEKAEETQRKWKEMSLLVHERREKLRKEREDYEINMRSDPLSAENVLNAEGKTLLSNIPEATEDKSSVGYKLAPPRVSVSIPKEANEERDRERAANRSLMRQSRHEGNVQTMMALFHEAKSFVHYGNLDHKVHSFIDSGSFPNRSLADMIESLHKNGGAVSLAEVTKRKQELQNTLQGTTGSHGNVGYDGLIKWLDEHEQDADGIHTIDEPKE